MAGFKVLRTDHTSFTVSDLDRSLSFYCDVLGFKLISKAGRDPAIIQRLVGVDGAESIVAYVKGPDHQLELIQYLKPDDRNEIRARACDTGFAHICFHVDDLEAAVQAVAEHGVLPVGEPVVINAGPNKGGKIIYLRDPDGITIEFIQPGRRPA